MPLFRRIADIISANLNEMVDHFEDPEKMLRQAVREMEQAVGRALDRAVTAVAHEKLLARQLADGRRQIERWQDRAQRAVQAGDDDLARRAIKRRIEHERAAEALADQQATAAELSRSLRRQIEDLRTKLAEAQRRLAAVTARRRVVEARARLLAVPTPHSGYEPLVGYDRWLERIEFAEAEADAWHELTGAAEEDTLDEPADVDLERVLASLKESFGKWK